MLLYGRFKGDSVSAKSNGDEESLVQGGAEGGRGVLKAGREDEVCLERIALLQSQSPSEQSIDSNSG